MYKNLIIICNVIESLYQYYYFIILLYINNNIINRVLF